jgi:uncharacterized membrane protein
MINNRAFLSILCCSILLVITAGQGLAGFFNKYDTVKPISGEIQIPLKEVNDGKAHYFIYDGKNQMVKFFVIKSADGDIRAAFDACDVCYPAKKGYTQEGEHMVCNNCGRRFHSNRINVVKGGCNPAPLMRSERDGNLVIRVEDVIKGAMYF